MYLVVSAVIAKTLTRTGLAAIIAWQSEILTPPRKTRKGVILHFVFKPDESSPEGAEYEDAI